MAKGQAIFWIGEGAESALDLIRALDRFHQQIVPEDDYGIHPIVLDIEMESMGRIVPINIRSGRPTADFIKIR